MGQTTVPFRPDDGHMWNVSVPRVCILTVLFVHILCNFSFHFFVALLLLRISLHLPPPARAHEMVNERVWIVNAERGEWAKKKKNNGKCWTKTWTVDGIQVIRSGSVGRGYGWFSRPEIRMRVDKWIAAFIIHCVSSIPRTRPLFSMSPLKWFLTVFHLQCITQIRSCII